MQVKDYPFTHCANPRIITNVYTGEKVTSRCGICPACLLDRSAQMCQLCELEQADYAYCYFITLTYSNLYVPCCRFDVKEFEYCASGHYGIDKRIELTDNETGDVLGYAPLSDLKQFTAAYWRSKNPYPNTVNYLRYSDVQKFLKRFRKRLSIINDEKIRFYAIGEYGPKHLRPHYHLLVFVNRQDTAMVLPRFIRESWTLGRTDCQLSKGGCTSYVAQYVNSNVALPAIYAHSALKPFCHHSRFFAQGFVAGLPSEVSQIDPITIAERDVQLGDTVTTLRPWRSLSMRLYPRCCNYANLNHVQCLQSYRLLLYARQQYKTSCKLDTLATMIARDVCDGVVNPVTKYFFDLESQREKHFNLSCILGCLYLSKHFLDFCCNGDYDYFKSEIMLRRIEEFYTYIDYKRLTDMYKAQEEYLTTVDTATPRHLINWYNDVFIGDVLNDIPRINHFIASIDAFRDSPPVHADKIIPMRALYDSYLHERLRKSIKHKEQNDNLINYFNIFNYD